MKSMLDVLLMDKILIVWAAALMIGRAGRGNLDRAVSGISA
jgi:hypothetical protein